MFLRVLRVIHYCLICTICTTNNATSAFSFLFFFGFKYSNGLSVVSESYSRYLESNLFIYKINMKFDLQLEIHITKTYSISYIGVRILYYVK